MISTIFGLHVRLADTGGSTILRGDCEPAAFMDLWDRAISSSGGDSAGGHASVGVDQPGVGRRRRLAVPDRTQAGIGGWTALYQLNIDGINLEFTSPDFMTGRLVDRSGLRRRTNAAISWSDQQFIATEAQTSGIFTPNGSINFCVGGDRRSKVHGDAGFEQRTPDHDPGAPIADFGDLGV